MTYMNYVQYGYYDVTMELSEDYRAIRWMQDNIPGSPVIIEAAPAGVQYAWHGRFSIYTGLPDVVGWEWHQLQQRFYSEDVRARGHEVDTFYRTTDIQEAEDFLLKYNARYIIVGQMERGKYIGDGLTKFDAFNGVYWNEIYRDGQIVIYEIVP
jgi:uncharacterized membrane protein